MISSSPPRTAATSKRISLGRKVQSSSNHRAASRRIRARFWTVTASAGTPKASVVRAFTSQKT